MQSMLQLAHVLSVNDPLTTNDAVEVSKPKLDRAKGARMVSIINISNSTKEPTFGYQNQNYQSLIGSWWVCEDERDSLYTQVIN